MTPEQEKKLRELSLDDMSKYTIKNMLASSQFQNINNDVRSKETRSNAGKIGGKKNVESGHIFALSKAQRKLTYEDAQLIRELYATKQYNQKQLSKMYGITQQTISKIMNNKRYNEK